ncbi:hypothetical protein RB195_009433 [Necator americanus]|uniref:Uncharacterized protein n=1 Tax=Necator americanus TaxID=51031 RepID=A0ABR1CTA2_NECAM
MGSCCSCCRRKETDLNLSEALMPKITYDCRGFSIHDMALLNKRHDPKGAAAYAKYRYYGDVQIIPTERLFQQMDVTSIIKDESFSLNSNVAEVKDVVRILFVKEYDDPFYLRLLENMLPPDEFEVVDETQTGSKEQVKTALTQKSSGKGGGGTERLSDSGTKSGESAVLGPIKSAEKSNKAKSFEKQSKERVPSKKILPVRPKEGNDKRNGEDEKGKYSKDEERRLRTEPTMPTEET